MAAIIGSLRLAHAIEDESVDRELVSPGIDVTDHLLPRLLDAVDLSHPLVLIFDDYHLLRGSPASDLLSALIAQMPASLHVVIATRADPRFPLGRLRAIGALEEIRSDQLRFDADEADRFLNGALGLDLDEGSLATLEERTEGWPAGLYLAALTLRGRTDRSQFVTDFAGRAGTSSITSARRSSTGSRRTTARSSCRPRSSPRLSGPLCDAVTGMPGSAARLRDLERANLFIVPLDGRGSWFRFHRLFAELLHSQLVATSPDLEPELHLRAARWLAEHGPMESAVEHALCRRRPGVGRGPGGAIVEPVCPRGRVPDARAADR